MQHAASVWLLSAEAPAWGRLKSKIYCFIKVGFFCLTYIKKKHVFMIAIQSYSLALFQHRHSTDTQIKTQSSYQNIFYSALKFHWSDLNDDTWKWCELQRKTKMLGEPIAGAAGLTLWHRPNQGDPARVTCWEEFQYLNALSTGKLKTKGTGTKYQTFNTNAWKPSAQK